MNYYIKLYRDKFTKNPKEFEDQISKIIKNIGEINEKIKIEIKNITKEYVNSNGIIEKKAEKNFLELEEEINNLDKKNENSIDELEKIVFRKID